MTATMRGENWKPEGSLSSPRPKRKEGGGGIMMEHHCGQYMLQIPWLQSLYVA